MQRARADPLALTRRHVPAPSPGGYCLSAANCSAKPFAFIASGSGGWRRVLSHLGRSRRKKNIEEHLSEIRLRFENLVRPLSIAAAW